MDVISILEKLENLGYLRLSRIIGDYFQIYCPIHNNGQERKPSCGILLHEQVKNGKRYPAGFCHCFSCGYVNDLPGLLTDILKSKHITQSGMDWLIENIPGFNGEVDFEYLVSPDVMKVLTDKYAVEYLRSATSPKPNFISEEELAKYRFTVPYMYERKLTDEIIEKYDVGVDINFVPEGRKKPVPCITFPVNDENGNTLFIYRRAIEGKSFYVPETVTKPVYGIDKLPKNLRRLFLCESIINALTLETWGYDAVALLGTGTPYQMDQLKRLGVREFVICTDGDEAGVKAIRRIHNALKSVAIVWHINMLPGKDVNDLTKDEFDALLQAME